MRKGIEDNDIECPNHILKCWTIEVYEWTDESKQATKTIWQTNYFKRTHSTMVTTLSLWFKPYKDIWEITKSHVARNSTFQTWWRQIW